ncbi:mannose-6-phosphate isomerase [Suillus clintonianus]|uniref:mannose-6-phosphate isomerase n=1 Tax=Suillus clintonianus TaxID=1904413 RepID=UPI001B87A2A5|nr:mannose-6-phosphate isomerase [Suillus clintonianus]KAG2150415.1 mannose-6-phosphate isomerase [Suillus clintonianus]
MSTIEPVFRIIPTVQNYDWGKKGKDSKVAEFASGAGILGFTLNQSVPYAELWMGTHVKSPSGVVDRKQNLAQILTEIPGLIGDQVSRRFDTTNGNLPFLFKVLAIGKALSIQTHPDKKTAEKLHAEQPTVYTDPNHKPEMALALTDFKALCGFMPIARVAEYVRTVPEFNALIDPSIATEFLNCTNLSEPEQKAVLKKLFAALMTADITNIAIQLRTLVARYQQGGQKPLEEDVKDLVLILNEQYPGDVGVFCAFMLNYVQMTPGQAIFLGAGEPHAYVQGDIMECMANSDNVIRAGLTPKAKDIPNLVSVLTYTASDWQKHMVNPIDITLRTRKYDPPIPDFTVLQVNTQKGETETHEAISGPSIAIATEGFGQVSWSGGKLDLQAGSVIFVGADTKIDITAGNSNLVVFRAYVTA